MRCCAVPCRALSSVQVKIRKISTYVRSCMRRPGCFPGRSMELLAFASRLLAPSVPFHSSSRASVAGGTARCATRLVSPNETCLLHTKIHNRSTNCRNLKYTLNIVYMCTYTSTSRSIFHFDYVLKYCALTRPYPYQYQVPWYIFVS